jgi:hypothetical protein
LKIQNVLKLKFCKLYFISYAQVQQRSYLWLELRFKKHSNFFYNTLHGHLFFFCNIHSYRKRETSQGEFSIECGAQLAYQVAPKING